MVVWRCAAWHPELITHVFAVCTPYAAPQEKYLSTLELTKGPLPQFGYQIHLASLEVESNITSKESIRQFLNGMYGARTSDGKPMFVPTSGILFENLPKVGKTKLMTDKVRPKIIFNAIAGISMADVYNRKWITTLTITIVMVFMVLVSAFQAMREFQIQDLKIRI